MITVLTSADCVGTHAIRLLSSQYLKLTMAVTIVAVDGKMVNNLRKSIDDCADCGLQVAFKWHACCPFPSLPPNYISVKFPSLNSHTY